MKNQVFDKHRQLFPYRSYSLQGDDTLKSPLLSNIMLHELDRELERQGLHFVRYADDFSIYVMRSALIFPTIKPDVQVIQR